MLNHSNIQQFIAKMEEYITIDAIFECQIIYVKCTYQVPPHLNLYLSSSKGISERKIVNSKLTKECPSEVDL